MRQTTPSPPIQIIASRAEIAMGLDHPATAPGLPPVARAIAFYADAAIGRSRFPAARLRGRAAVAEATAGSFPFVLVEISAKGAADLDERYRDDGTAVAFRPKDSLVEAARIARDRNDSLDLGHALASEREKVSVTRAELDEALGGNPRSPIAKAIAAAAGAVRQPQWQKRADGSFAHTGRDANGTAGLAALRAQFGAGESRAVILDRSLLARAIEEHPERQALAAALAQRAQQALQRQARSIVPGIAAKRSHGML